MKPYSDVDQISTVHKSPSTTDVQNLTTPPTVNQTQKAIMKKEQIPPTSIYLKSKDEHIKEVQQQKFIQIFIRPVPKIMPSSTTAPKSEIPSGRDTRSQTAHLQLRQFIGQDWQLWSVVSIIKRISINKAFQLEIRHMSFKHRLLSISE